MQHRATKRGTFLDDLCDRLVDADLIAGLWLWFWDDPSRMFRIGIILASMVGWGAIYFAIKEPVTAAFEFDAWERPPLLILLGGRDARWLPVAAVCLLNRPPAPFTVAGLAYGSGRAHRIALMRQQ